MTCYYCLHNIKDKKCELDVEGYPLPASTECRHFEFDSGPPNEDDIDEDYNDIDEGDCEGVGDGASCPTCSHWGGEGLCCLTLSQEETKKRT